MTWHSQIYIASLAVSNGRLSVYGQAPYRLMVCKVPSALASMQDHTSLFNTGFDALYEAGEGLSGEIRYRSRGAAAPHANQWHDSLPESVNVDPATGTNFQS